MEMNCAIQQYLWIIFQFRSYTFRRVFMWILIHLAREKKNVQDMFSMFIFWHHIYWGTIDLFYFSWSNQENLRILQERSHIIVFRKRRHEFAPLLSRKCSFHVGFIMCHSAFPSRLAIHVGASRSVVHGFWINSNSLSHYLPLLSVST